MNNQIVKNIVRFVLLIVIQVFIFNKINLGGYLNPYVYLMFVILLPFETPGWLLLTSSFAAGLSVDIFTGSLGIHAAATTFVAFTRPFMVRALLPKLDKGSGYLPGINSMGLATFSVYTLIFVFIHHFILFFIEVFRFSETGSILLRVLFSTLLSSAMIIILEILFKRND
jgi:rod shape-determining protein MreD